MLIVVLTAGNMPTGLRSRGSHRHEILLYNEHLFVLEIASVYLHVRGRRNGRCPTRRSHRPRRLVAKMHVDASGLSWRRVRPIHISLSRNDRCSSRSLEHFIGHSSSCDGDGSEMLAEAWRCGLSRDETTSVCLDSTRRGDAAHRGVCRLDASVTERRSLEKR